MWASTTEASGGRTGSASRAAIAAQLLDPRVEPRRIDRRRHRRRARARPGRPMRPRRPGRAGRTGRPRRGARPAGQRRARGDRARGEVEGSRSWCVPFDVTGGGLVPVGPGEPGGRPGRAGPGRCAIAPFPGGSRGPRRSRRSRGPSTSRSTTGARKSPGSGLQGVVDGQPVGDGLVEVRRAGWADATSGASPGRRGRRWRDRPALAAAELVEAGVGGDPVGPGRERGPAVVAVEAAGDGDQGVLGGVERVVLVAGHASADGVDAVVVAAQQGVEGRAVAGLGRLDEGARRSSSAADRPVLSP